MEARTDNLGVVVRGCSSDIELSDCDFVNGGSSESGQGLDESTALTSLEMGLCTNTINGSGICLINTVDKADDTSDLGVVRVEVVVVDIETTKDDK